MNSVTRKRKPAVTNIKNVNLLTSNFKRSLKIYARQIMNVKDIENIKLGDKSFALKITNALTAYIIYIIINQKK